MSIYNRGEGICEGDNGMPTWCVQQFYDNLMFEEDLDDSDEQFVKLYCDNIDNLASNAHHRIYVSHPGPRWGFTKEDYKNLFQREDYIDVKTNELYDECMHNFYHNLVKDHKIRDYSLGDYTFGNYTFEDYTSKDDVMLYTRAAVDNKTVSGKDCIDYFGPESIYEIPCDSIDKLEYPNIYSPDRKLIDESYRLYRCNDGMIRSYYKSIKLPDHVYDAIKDRMINYYNSYNELYFIRQFYIVSREWPYKLYTIPEYYREKDHRLKNAYFCYRNQYYPNLSINRFNDIFYLVFKNKPVFSFNKDNLLLLEYEYRSRRSHGNRMMLYQNQYHYLRDGKTVDIYYLEIDETTTVNYDNHKHQLCSMATIVCDHNSMPIPLNKPKIIMISGGLRTFPDLFSSLSDRKKISYCIIAARHGYVLTSEMKKYIHQKVIYCIYYRIRKTEPRLFEPKLLNLIYQYV